MAEIPAEYQREYERLCGWRERWTRLSSQRGPRLASRQEAIERRARIANGQIGKLMQDFDKRKLSETMPDPTIEQPSAAAMRAAGKIVELHTEALWGHQEDIAAIIDTELVTMREQKHNGSVTATRIIQVLQGSIDDGYITFPDWMLETWLQRRDATIRREAFDEAIEAVEGELGRDGSPIAAIVAARDREGTK